MVLEMRLLKGCCYHSLVDRYYVYNLALDLQLGSSTEAEQPMRIPPNLLFYT